MTNPVERIGRGLDDIERAKLTPGVSKLAALASAPSTPAQFQTIQINVSKATARLLEMSKAASENFCVHKVKKTEEWNSRGWEEGDHGRVDTMGATARKRFLDNDLRAYVKTQIAGVTEEHSKLVSELKAAKDSLALVADAWASPTALLMRQTLGSEKRSTYTANLANAGPKELELAMLAAVQTSDADLAAACCVRMDSIGKEPRKSIKFSKADVAEMICGAEWSKVAEAVAVSGYLIGQGELADAELRGKSVSPKARIGLGVKLHDTEVKIGRKLIDDEGKLTTDESDGELVRYTGKVSISESNRRWFAEHGTHGTGGEINAD